MSIESGKAWRRGKKKRFTKNDDDARMTQTRACFLFQRACEDAGKILAIHELILAALAGHHWLDESRGMRTGKFAVDKERRCLLR